MSNNGQQAIINFLKQSVGKQCTVALSNRVEVRGVLCTIDGFLNLVLKNAGEYVQGQKIFDFPSVFIRGNNVTHVAPIESTN